MRNEKGEMVQGYRTVSRFSFLVPFFLPYLYFRRRDDFGLGLLFGLLG